MDWCLENKHLLEGRWVIVSLSWLLPVCIQFPPPPPISPPHHPHHTLHITHSYIHISHYHIHITHSHISTWWRGGHWTWLDTLDEDIYPFFLSHRHILELGSGVGLAGIAVCCECNPASYCFTDCHEDVLERLNENIEINIAPQSIFLFCVYEHLYHMSRPLWSR